MGRQKSVQPQCQRLFTQFLPLLKFNVRVTVLKQPQHRFRQFDHVTLGGLVPVISENAFFTDAIATLESHFHKGATQSCHRFLQPLVLAFAGAFTQCGHHGMGAEGVIEARQLLSGQMHDLHPDIQIRLMSMANRIEPFLTINFEPLSQRKIKYSVLISVDRFPLPA